jgi:hypothetical protein
MKGRHLRGERRAGKGGRRSRHGRSRGPAERAGEVTTGHEGGIIALHGQAGREAGAEDGLARGRGPRTGAARGGVNGGIPELISTPGRASISARATAALLHVYGRDVQPKRKGKRGRKPKPVKVPPKGLTYATVHKTRANNRVVKVEARVVYGTKKAVKAALGQSAVSGSVNTVFVERHNGTDRNRNARKVRKTYCFSKDWAVHEALTYFTMHSDNFCWPVRTLRQKVGKKRYRQRTPAMAAGLTGHVWSLREWLTYPSFDRAKRVAQGPERRQQS